MRDIRMNIETWAAAAIVGALLVYLFVALWRAEDF
jgi:K+-transporting ATPase KdpF subunit